MNYTNRDRLDDFMTEARAGMEEIERALETESSKPAAAAIRKFLRNIERAFNGLASNLPEDWQ